MSLKVDNWSEFSVVVLGIFGFLGIAILTIPVLSLWESWWALRIWSGYVVPTTHWPLISQATFFALLLLWGLFRTPTMELKDHEYKYGSWFVAYIIAGPLANFFCWLAFKWWF